MDDDASRDTERESEDDALEDTRPDDIFDPGTDEEKLAEDNAPPAAPADDVPVSSPQDDPAGDDYVDPDEQYQEGRSNAVDDSNQIIGPDERPRPLEPEE